MYTKLLLGFSLAAIVVLAVAQTPADDNEAHRQYCARFSGDCGACVAAQSNYSEGGRCYFCNRVANGTEKVCLAYGYTLPIQATTECPALNYHIDNCVLTALIYVIFICIIFVLVVFCCCTFWCCCCCCCYRRKLRQRDEEEERYTQEKDSIRQKSTERRAERKAKNDEIRKKYGLNDSNAVGTYKRLE